MEMKGINQHILPLESGWGVYHAYPSPHIILEFKTLDEAMAFASKQAERYEGEVLLHQPSAHTVRFSKEPYEWDME